MSVSEHVISPDGTRIAFRRIGTPGAGPPIVALHGGLGSWRSWEPVARRLADRHELLLVDRRGRGDSDDGAEPYALAREIDDVRAVVAAAGPGARAAVSGAGPGTVAAAGPGAALLGHSFGGLLALEATRVAEPGEIGGLLLYEPAAGVGGLIPDDLLDRMRARIADGELSEAVAEGMRALDVAGLVTADGPLSTGRIRLSPAFARTAATVARELAAADAQGDDLSRYAAIDLPALVLLGTASPPQTQRLCHTLATTLPRAALAELPGLGHVAHATAPDRVAAELSAFLAGAGNQAAPGESPRRTG